MGAEKKDGLSSPGKRPMDDVITHPHRDLIPELRPVDARTPRRGIIEEMEGDAPEIATKRIEKKPSPNAQVMPKEAKDLNEDEEAPSKPNGQQSDI
jgi:hypothetical protein